MFVAMWEIKSSNLLNFWSIICISRAVFSALLGPEPTLNSLSAFERLLNVLY